MKTLNFFRLYSILIKLSPYVLVGLPITIVLFFAVSDLIDISLYLPSTIEPTVVHVEIVTNSIESGIENEKIPSEKSDSPKVSEVVADSEESEKDSKKPEESDKWTLVDKAVFIAIVVVPFAMYVYSKFKIFF